MPTTVVHVRDVDLSDPDVTYIGRAMPRRRLAGSRWSNPYRVTRDQPRETAIRLYRLYVTDRPDLMAALETLRGKRLACWCAPSGGVTATDPLICHGQVLAALVDGLEPDHAIR